MSSKLTPFSKNVDDAIKNYVDIISEKFNISKDELLQLWNKSDTSEVSESNVLSNTNQDLEKLSKDKLVEMCKSKGLKYSGTKKVLIEYLTGATDGTSSKKSSSKEKQSLLKSEVEKEEKIIKKIVSKIPTIPIHRNKFGNFEHSETSLVFNNKTQQVIGKQNSNGKIDTLTPDDIDTCNKYKFSYIIPENLDKATKNDVEKEKIDELDDVKNEDIEVEDETENNIEEDLEEDLEEDEEIEDEVEIEDEYEEEYLDDDY
jgi:hypothetical protein